MSLKNEVKIKKYVAKAILSDKTILTLYGELAQSSMKDQIIVQRVLTTPGGKILEEKNPIVMETFDNQNGIRKEFSMGWSVCQSEDFNVYDKDLAIKYASMHFSRPLVTYNFTYLNYDQIKALMMNEIDFIVNRNFNKMSITELTFECYN